MILYIYIYLNPLQVSYHEVLVSAWFELVSSDYHSCTYINSGDLVSEADSRTRAMYVALDRYEEEQCALILVMTSIVTCVGIAHNLGSICYGAHINIQ